MHTHADRTRQIDIETIIHGTYTSEEGRATLDPSRHHTTDIQRNLTQPRGLKRRQNGLGRRRVRRRVLVLAALLVPPGLGVLDAGLEVRLGRRLHRLQVRRQRRLELGRVVVALLGVGELGKVGPEGVVQARVGALEGVLGLLLVQVLEHVDDLGERGEHLVAALGVFAEFAPGRVAERLVLRHDVGLHAVDVAFEHEEVVEVAVRGAGVGVAEPAEGGLVGILTPAGGGGPVLCHEDALLVEDAGDVGGRGAARALRHVLEDVAEGLLFEDVFDYPLVGCSLGFRRGEGEGWIRGVGGGRVEIAFAVTECLPAAVGGRVDGELGGALGLEDHSVIFIVGATRDGRVV